MPGYKPIKRTVAIHPLLDTFVRETWSIMVKDPDAADATYSAALNLMLLGAVEEATKKGGWSDETREIAWSFAADRSTLEDIGLQEFLPKLKERLERHELGPLTDPPSLPPI